MSTQKMLSIYGAILLVVSLPFVFIHLAAGPDDAPISPLQHAVAALANYLGPWGIAAVRLVDFPNAGMRSFSWILAVGLTVLALLLVAVPLRIRNRLVQRVCAILFALFLVVWFSVGLMQIADGLL